MPKKSDLQYFIEKNTRDEVMKQNPNPDIRQTWQLWVRVKNGTTPQSAVSPNVKRMLKQLLGVEGDISNQTSIAAVNYLVAKAYENVADFSMNILGTEAARQAILVENIPPPAEGENIPPQGAEEDEGEDMNADDDNADIDMKRPRDANDDADPNPPKRIKNERGEIQAKPGGIDQIVEGPAPALTLDEMVNIYNVRLRNFIRIAGFEDGNLPSADEMLRMAAEYHLNLDNWEKEQACYYLATIELFASGEVPKVETDEYRRYLDGITEEEALEMVKFKLVAQAVNNRTDGEGDKRMQEGTLNTQMSEQQQTEEAVKKDAQQHTEEAVKKVAQQPSDTSSTPAPSPPGNVMSKSAGTYIDDGKKFEEINEASKVQQLTIAHLQSGRKYDAKPLDKTPGPDVDGRNDPAAPAGGQIHEEARGSLFWDPIHPYALAIYFGDKDSGYDWDPDLFRYRDELFRTVSIEKQIEYCLMQSRDIVDEHGHDIFVYDLVYSGGTMAILENREIVQLWASLKRGFTKGPRVSTIEVQYPPEKQETDTTNADNEDDQAPPSSLVINPNGAKPMISTKNGQKLLNAHENSRYLMNGGGLRDMEQGRYLIASMAKQRPKTQFRLSIGEINTPIPDVR